MYKENFENVLVMIDDLDQRELLYDVLTQLNYKVTTTPTVNELIDSLKIERFDNIVMNMDSSDIKTEVLLGMLRYVDEQIRIIILMSGSIDQDILERLFDKHSRITILRKDMDTPKIVQSIIKTIKEQQIEEDDSPIKYMGKILIVDDEERLAKTVSRFLSKRGYDTDVAYSGEEAILKIKVNKPKVIVLDVLMPGMDGLIVLKQIKEIDSSIAVIVTSGIFENEKLVDDAMRLGALTYLPKPYSLKHLESFVLSSIIKKDQS